MRVGGVAHGAKFDDDEGLTIFAGSALAKQYRAAELSTYQTGDEDQYRAEQDQQ